jgi:hypothetical protein
MKQYLAVIDRAATQVNVFLMVIAIGLGVLDMTVLIGKDLMVAIPKMPTTRAHISGSGDLFEKVSSAGIAAPGLRLTLPRGDMPRSPFTD